jgi:energy-coupling factor transporter ATP-binding protein EcfA2
MADAGRVEWGYETYPGYFAQDHREQLGDRATVEEWLWDACPSEGKGFVRNQLGLVLFSGEEAEKKLSSLSGGEAARLVFARMAIEQPNVLLLDEPTNHLDLEAIDALVAGLRAFDGTLVFVSHDRWFVSQLATRVVEITPTGLNDFRGTYDEYLDACGDDHLDAESVVLRVRRERRKERPPAEARSRPDPEQRRREQELKGLRLRRDAVTARLEAAEARVEEVNRLFCDPELYGRTPPDGIRSLQAEHQRLTAEVAELVAEWERLEAEIAG